MILDNEFDSRWSASVGKSEMSFVRCSSGKVCLEDPSVYHMVSV